MSSEYPTVHVAVQLAATRALLKFCREHRRYEQELERVRQCLGAFVAGDVATAVKHYRAVPLSGNALPGGRRALDFRSG